MRLTKEDRYQLKLWGLAKEIGRNNKLSTCYMMHRCLGNAISHTFYVEIIGEDGFLVYRPGFETAEKCYKWAISACKKKGLIR